MLALSTSCPQHQLQISARDKNICSGRDREVKTAGAALRGCTNPEPPQKEPLATSRFSRRWQKLFEIAGTLAEWHCEAARNAHSKGVPRFPLPPLHPPPTFDLLLLPRLGEETFSSTPFFLARKRFASALLSRSAPAGSRWKGAAPGARRRGRAGLESLSPKPRKQGSLNNLPKTERGEAEPPSVTRNFVLFMFC